MDEQVFITDNRRESGSIGIGAMIVFIALILVAAVASTIIIKTAEELQQNAESTSDDTRKQISGKVSIVEVLVKTVADPLNSGSSTDVATMEVIGRISSGSIGVADGDIEYSISCKVSYTATSTTFAVVDSGTADLKGLGDTTGISATDMIAGGTYVITTVGDATFGDIDVNGDDQDGSKADGSYLAGDEITVASDWDGVTGAGATTTGVVYDDAFFVGEELTAGTVFKFTIDLGVTNTDNVGTSEDVIDFEDFALGLSPGCDAESAAGQQLDMRVVVDGGGETLATLKIDSIVLGSSMM
jgi:archaellin